MSAPAYRVERYADRAGRHRWRLVSAVNGQTVCTAHQGFHSAAEREANLRRCAAAFREVAPEDAPPSDP
jgi:uncharacterized protein YegP (UPF0339 family)